MKQTNNAIKFLMAQYRAIFKNAYFKGMATALVLTAGLAAGAAQANSGYVLQGPDDSKAWKWVELKKDQITSNSILAGTIAGNKLDTLDSSITPEDQAAIKANGSASNATIYIGDVPTGALGIGSMTSGAAAGGWATTSGSMIAEASNNTVIVNESGYVDKGKTDARGVIYGGRANATEGFAVANGNTIRVEKAEASCNKAAAEEKIVGGTALGFTGATASNNRIIIKGTEQHRQAVAAGNRANTLFGLTGGTVAIKKSGAYGTYEASNNSLELTAISVNSENTAFLFVAGRADLSSGKPGSAVQVESGSGIANNNSVQLSDSVINTSGGSLWANNIEGGSGSVSTKIDGNGRGISISDSTITSTDNLSLRASSLTNNKSTGSTSVNNSRIEIANTRINVTGSGKSGEITGAYVQNVASSNVEAANNTISITEESSNYNADSKTFARSITADITGANVQNTYSGADAKLVISATGNSINVGTAVSVTGDVVGASVSASGSKIATMSLNDNSVSVAGKVVGNIKAVSFTNQGTAPDAENNKLSFLNNDVSLLDGADVSSGSLVGGAGKDSVVTIANGSTYTANQTNNNIASDVIDIDGTVVVDASKTLTISGFFENGKETADKYHENLTTAGSTAVFKNAGTIKVYGKVVAEDGAVFTGTSADSQIVVDGYSSKQAAMNDLLKDEDRVENAGFGVLGMSSAQLTSYLAADKVLSSTTNDNAGKLVLKSGGALELTDTGNVDIATTFNFTSGSAQAGQIQVDANAQSGGSIIRGNEITVSRKLASNAVTAGNITAATTYDGLNPLGMSGIQIEANTLHLGASDLSSAKSEDILFNKATAKNVINFYGLHNNATEEKIKNDGFHLVSAVYGDNYMVTTDQDTGLDYYTALDGDINGDVTITNDTNDGGSSHSGSLNIQNGNWVAHGNVTLNESGSLLVGGDDGIDDTNSRNDPISEDRGPDATLAFDNDLVVDLSDSADTKITASGAQTYRYDFDYAAETIGDDRLAQIDLRNGLTIVGSSASGEVGKLNGKTTITATSGGVILLDSADLNTILTQNDANSTDSGSGAYFVANSGGAFIVTGDVNADFNDFNASGSISTVHGITLADGGYLVADSVTISNAGETGLSTAKDESSYTFNSVAWGDGTIDVDDLVISDLQTTNGTTKPSGATVYASKVTVTEGDALIHKSLTSNNNTLILGVSDGASEADFTFATDAVAAEGAISVNNLHAANGALVFENGKWDATSTTFDLGASGALTVGGNSGTDINDQDTYASLEALGLKMAAGADATIAADGKATFARADFSALTVDSGVVAGTLQNVNVYGHLIINGDTSATITQNNTQVDDPKNGVAFGAEGTLQIRNNGILEFSGAAVNGAIIADADYSTAASVTEAMVDGYTKIANYGGVLKLDFASGTEFSAEAIKQLKTELFTSGSLNDGVLTAGGILNIGDASFHGIQNPTPLEGEGLSGYTAKWEDVEDFSDIYGNDVTNNTLMQTNVSDIRVGNRVQGHWGSLSMASDSATSAQVTIAGHTTLNYAEGNRGYFISNASRNAALGADVQAQKSLKLVNNGTEASIGNVTLQGVTDNSGNALDVDTNFTTLEVTGAGTTTIRSVNGIGGLNAQGYGYADGTAFKVSANTNVTEDIDNIEYVDVANASLSAQNADVHSINGINANITIADTASFNEAEVLGGKFSTKLANYDHRNSDDNTVLVSNGGTFSAEKFVFADNTGGTANSTRGYLEVGVDLSLLSAEDLTLDDGSKVTTGAGYFEAGVMELNGNTIVVDPEYGDGTSVAAVGKFQLNDRQTYKYANDKGVLEGELLIGKNAALGIGATLAETKDAISTYQQNGSLQEDRYGSILYLNGQLTVSNGSSISLNSSKDAKTDADIREANKYVIAENQHDQYAALGLGANTAILMTENAFEDDKGAKTGTAIYFDRKAAVVNGAGGDIILAGDFDAAEKLNIFNDKDNNGVRVEGSIDVRTQNGFLMYTLSGEDEGMGVQLQVDKVHAYGVMSDASDPVVETLIAYHTERGGATTDSNNNAGDNSSNDTVPASVVEAQQPNTVAQTETRSGPILDGTPSDTPNENPDQGQDGATGGEGDAGTDGSQDTPQTSNVRGYSSFLSMVSNNTHGAPAEAAARLAIYGGAVQAAMAATSSTTDAIAARMGVGNTANITMANNGQGAALWLAPVYKTHDSDSFDSQGLDYGVDLNLYGVALGADFEFMPGLTAGIMFNVGSGDADGQGNAAANNTSNDFDYWGAAIYGNYTYDALSVTADVSYTAVDNDLEATTGMQQYGKLESSTDTTAISLGVTAKYTFDFGGVEVAPHAGLRYTNIDLDDYSIKSNGETIADYSADKVNIFSIPVGVTFAKEFTGDAWTVKPSLDLTLTGNFGDDDISGDVSWTGVDGLVTPVSSEYMDDFTYGATLGIEAASTGGFSLGLGVNYTGSSNVDEFGVNANARFVF